MAGQRNLRKLRVSPSMDSSHFTEVMGIRFEGTRKLRFDGRQAREVTLDRMGLSGEVRWTRLVPEHGCQGSTDQEIGEGHQFRD